MKYKNTLQRGSARFIVFREGDTWYGTCLDFNIVEEGTTAREALLLLFEAVEGYLESARKIKARPAVLNQKADAEYEMMWTKLRAAKSKVKEIDSKSIYSFGELSIGKRALAPA